MEPTAISWLHAPSPKVRKRSRGEIEKELCGGETTPTTNNRMELTAPIRALTALTRPSVVDPYTDSTYVRNGIMSWLASWKRNGWRTKDGRPVKNEDLWRELGAAVAAAAPPSRTAADGDRRRSSVPSQDQGRQPVPDHCPTVWLVPCP